MADDGVSLEMLEEREEEVLDKLDALQSTWTADDESRAAKAREWAEAEQVAARVKLAEAKKAEESAAVAAEAAKDGLLLQEEKGRQARLDHFEDEFAGDEREQAEALLGLQKQRDEIQRRMDEAAAKKAWSEKRGHEILLAHKARVPQIRKEREKRREAMRAKKLVLVAEQEADLEGAAQRVQAAFRGRQARVKGGRRRVAVFGATGQLGGAICRHCLQQGFDVVGMSRRPDSDRSVALHRAGARIQFGDLDEPHSIDRFLAFVVHGDQFNRHTAAHTHIVEPAHIFTVFIIVPHSHYDSGGHTGSGWQRDSAVELSRHKHAIDACKRARVRHVVLLSGCAGLETHGAGPRSELFQRTRLPRAAATCWNPPDGQARRCCFRPPWEPPVPGGLPPYLAAKPAAEAYLIEQLGQPKEYMQSPENPDGIGMLQPRGKKTEDEKLAERVRDRLRKVAGWNGSDELSREFDGLRTVFEGFDTDGDGTVSQSEFRAALRKLKLGVLTTDIDRLYAKCDVNEDGDLDYTEFIEKVLRVEKTLVSKANEDGGQWEVGWTILRPALLMDNFWSWQVPWFHPKRNLRLVHEPKTKLQLIWSDDVGAVASRILAEMDDSKHGRDEAAVGRQRWHARALDLISDEATPTEAAFTFSKLRGRRGHRIRYRQQLPPVDACCTDLHGASLCGCLCVLRLQERACWGYDHATVADARWHAAGGGGGDSGRLRLEYPWLATLESAAGKSDWASYPSPEWSSSLLCGWLSAPQWMLATLLSPCGVAAWTATKLWPDEEPETHGMLYGCTAVPYCVACSPCMASLLRTRTRMMLAVDEPGCGTFGTCDTAAVTCCPLCALAQQAREIHLRTRLVDRHPRCCCEPLCCCCGGGLGGKPAGATAGWWCGRPDEHARQPCSRTCGCSGLDDDCCGCSCRCCEHFRDCWDGHLPQYMHTDQLEHSSAGPGGCCRGGCCKCCCLKGCCGRCCRSCCPRCCYCQACCCLAAGCCYCCKRCHCCKCCGKGHPDRNIVQPEEPEFNPSIRLAPQILRHAAPVDGGSQAAGLAALALLGGGAERPTTPDSSAKRAGPGGAGGAVGQPDGGGRAEMTIPEKLALLQPPRMPPEPAPAVMVMER